MSDELHIPTAAELRDQSRTMIGDLKQRLATVEAAAKKLVEACGLMRDYDRQHKDGIQDSYELDCLHRTAMKACHKALAEWSRVAKL